MKRLLKFFKTKKPILKKAAILSSTAILTYKLTENLEKMNPTLHCLLEDTPNNENKIAIANENIREINNISLGDVTFFEEGKIYSRKIMMQDGSYKIIIIKHEDEFYALSAISPYDGSTDLSKGKVFGNKLLSPKNGSAYNIKNGEVEYGPGMDNIPVFKTIVDNGQLVVQIPKKPPVKIRPYVSVRDYADMRKVVIIGGSEAALTCAETLRSLEYTVRFYS